MPTPPGFHEIQFPTNIGMGAVGGPGFNTSVQMLASGFERRNINWSKERAKYNIPMGNKPKEEMIAAIKFFYARRGKAYGFRFKDWADFQNPFWNVTPGDLDPIPTLFTTDGVTATFQLTKTYDDAILPFTRTITKPVVSTLQLSDGSSPLLVPTVDYNVNGATGLVTLSGALQGTTGHLIKGSFEFDVPVRLDLDEMDMTTLTQHLMEWSNIPLIEVRV